jgi:hypothetical protein
MFFQARFYDPAIGRFSSADTVIPPGVQGLDRYAFVYNNPIRYTDPSGHVACLDDGYCGNGDYSAYLNWSYRTIQKDYHITFSGEWGRNHKRAALMAAVRVGGKFASVRAQGEYGGQAFSAIYGAVQFTMGNCGECKGGGGANYGYNKEGGYHDIRFDSMDGDNLDPVNMDHMIKNVVHELGHAYYNEKGRPALGDAFSRDALRPNPCDRCYDLQMHPPSMNEGGAEITSELFADTFLAWTYDAWNLGSKETIVDAVSNARAAMDGFVRKP